MFIPGMLFSDDKLGEGAGGQLSSDLTAILTGLWYNQVKLDIANLGIRHCGREQICGRVGSGGKVY